MSGLIYTPKGRAREYSPLAVNLYGGCTHGCRYCYVPGTWRKTREWYQAADRPRPLLRDLERKAARLYGTDRQVLVSFGGDPYCPTEETEHLTRRALEILLAAHIPAAVLTKGGGRCLRDLDLFRAFGRHIKVGATLTFRWSPKEDEVEPGAARSMYRIYALQDLHAAGVGTWASTEPVIDPEDSLEAIKASVHCVDEYRLGHLLRGGDSTAYLEAALAILRAARKSIYVKTALRDQAATVDLAPEETDCDRYLAEPWGAPA